MWERDVYQNTAFSASTSWTLIIASTCILVGVIIIAFMRARRRSELAQAAEASVGDKSPALAEGDNVVLSGVVRHIEDKVAVRVTIDQEGSQRTYRGSTTHSWVEKSRKVEVATFKLELPSGEAILVHPSKNVELVDALDKKFNHNKYQRTWVAELADGEKIFARGRLERSDVADPAAAYRDVNWGWALQPSSTGKMLLSSEPMGHGLRSRASFHRKMGLFAIGLLCALQATLGLFYARAAVGTVQPGSITNFTSWLTHNKNSTTTHYGLWFEAPIVGRQMEEIDDSDFDFYGGYTGEMDGLHTVPVVVASQTNWQLGAKATIRWWHALIILGSSIIFVFWYIARRKMTRPWFRRKLNENGSGPLPEHW
ncbi:MAG TPA: hypothetical protein VGM39_14615 [Kofleriaceae bacterium]